MEDIPTTIDDIDPERTVYLTVSGHKSKPHLNEDCGKMQDPDPEDKENKPAAVLFNDEKLCRQCRDYDSDTDEEHPVNDYEFSYEQHKLVETV